MKKVKVLLSVILGLSLLSLGLTNVFAYEEDKSIVYKFWQKVLPVQEERLELGGFVKNETSVHLAGGFDRFMKINNVMGMKTNIKITDWMELFTYYRWFWDSVFTVEDRLYGNVSFEDVNRKLRMPEKLQWLRECYVDIYTDRLDIRAGKQQVVWGTADGVRILDMVNPLDYREWTLKEYVETRIPLWMINIEGELMMDGHLQLLLIPDYQPNYYAPAGAPFTLRTVDIGQQGTDALDQAGFTVSTISEKPAKQFKNTKIGLRWQNIIGGWDYTLNYLHTYDFASSAYTRITFFPSMEFELKRRSEQIDIFGASFSKTLTEGFLTDLLKGWTLRGEFAYIKGGAMNYGYDESIIGTVDVDQYNYCLGFDRNFWTNWLFSYQFIQFIAHNTEDIPGATSPYSLLFGPTRGGLDKLTTMMTLKVATDFMHERLKPEILLIYGFDRDWRISPKVSYEINDEWTIAGGLHVFGGDEQGLNGQFDKNDQLFVETTYNW
ncbi:MAG: hypothetical protein ISS43_02070 [Candidatus Omnitrophica bacterium]|nr:hypothetical protein [Candidatus Omnitrophota bacterium]